jgi:hypothetical protein
MSEFTSFFVKVEGVWHFCRIDDDAEQQEYLCGHCGKRFPISSPSFGVPEETTLCKVEFERAFPGTGIQQCNFYGALDSWFWVGVPPIGMPVAVANIKDATVIPTERFDRFFDFTKQLVTRMTEQWHEHSDAEQPIHEFLGMTEEEYLAYIAVPSQFPGDILDLRSAGYAFNDTGGEVPDAVREDNGGTCEETGGQSEESEGTS